MKPIFALTLLFAVPSAWAKLSCSTVETGIFSKSTHHLNVDLVAQLAIHTVTSCSLTAAGERCSDPQVAVYSMGPLQANQWSLAPLLDPETSDHLTLTIKKHSPHSRVCYSYGFPYGCSFHKLQLENEEASVMSCSTDYQSE